MTREDKTSWGGNTEEAPGPRLNWVQYSMAAQMKAKGSQRLRSSQSYRRKTREREGARRDVPHEGQGINAAEESCKRRQGRLLGFGELWEANRTEEG